MIEEAHMNRMRAARRATVFIAGAVTWGWVALSTAGASTTTDTGASILIFPNVVVDATQKTVIQITNISNQLQHLRCFYIDGATCDSTEFAIVLTRQQPTFWVAARGRPVRRRDDLTGIDPGVVPPVASGFRGSLYCVAVDDAMMPINTNALTGVATLKANGGPDVAKYNAVGLVGTDSNDGNDTLCIGGGVSPACPSGAEYEGCPLGTLLDHSADFAEDPLIGSGSSVQTVLTIVPCTYDFINQMAGTSNVFLNIHDEFEGTYSASTSVGCWLSQPLSSINPVFSLGGMGSTYAQTRLSPSGTGFVAVGQEIRTGSGLRASVGVNMHNDGEFAGSDLLTLPVPTP
jgi:hypothetical protein